MNVCWHACLVWIDRATRWFVAAIGSHEGFFMVLLTSALVWFAYKSAKIALRNLELIKLNDDKRTLPYVTLEVVNDMPFYGVRMVNLGKTSAHNIVVESNPKIEMLFPNYKKPIGFLQNHVPYLAPSGHYETDIGSFRDIEKENPSKVYQGRISFQNDDGKTFTHDFVLDFSPFTDAIHKDVKTVHEVAKQLEEIKRELSNIGTGFHKPHVLTEEYAEYEDRVKQVMKEPLSKAQSCGKEDQE